MLGRKIREWREKHGISQEELAKKLGVTQEAVSYWENGKKHPKRSTFKKLIEISNGEIKPEDYLG